MKLSTTIKKLNSLLEAHGDLNVYLRVADVEGKCSAVEFATDVSRIKFTDKSAVMELVTAVVLSDDER